MKYKMTKIYSGILYLGIQIFWLPTLGIGMFLYWLSPSYDYWKWDRPSWAAGGLLIATLVCLLASTLEDPRDPWNLRTELRNGRLRPDQGALEPDWSRLTPAKANLLICGIFYSIAHSMMYFSILRGFLIVAGHINLLVGVMGCCCIRRFPGSEILSDLFHTRDIVSFGFEMLMDREERKTLLQSGVGGIGVLALSIMMLVVQMVPLLAAVYILEVILCEIM